VVPSSDGCMIFRCRGSVALLLQNGTTVVRGRRRWSVSATTTVSKATPPETPIPSSAANGLSYGGFCPSCGRQHFLPCTPEAEEAALRLVCDLKRRGTFDFGPSGGPGDAFDISTLVNPGPGRMLGVLICEAPDNGSERIVLKAFSGQVAWINYYCDGNLSPTTLKIHNFILRSPRNIFP